MKLTIYTADTCGQESNVYYPNRLDVADEATFKDAVSFDHVAARYQNNYRSNANFIESDHISMDCDNGKSDDPETWILPEDILSLFEDVSLAIATSRNHMKEKGMRSARPRFHVYFPIPETKDGEGYAKLKEELADFFSFFDAGALGSARFMYGNPDTKVIWRKGDQLITDFIRDDFAEWDEAQSEIPEGSRNKTLSHYAGRIIIRLGATEEAHAMFLKKADLCNPPLPDHELQTIWQSAMRFEKESINTMDSKGEVLLTIMASLAQQENQSLSQNVKLGLQYRYQQGKVLVNHNRFLGYGKDEEGGLIIIPEEAEIIRRIYREYLEGQSPYAIAKNLEKDGILTGAGKTKWYDTTIRKILQNEKYIGDALLQKTYTVDFLSKHRVKNTGEVPQYYVEDHHEAIIPKNIFYAVQEEMLRRQSGKRGKNGVKRSYSSNNCFSNIVVCGNCGDIFRRVHWNNRGKKSIVWRCVSRLENRGTKCTARTLPEDDLILTTMTAFKKMLTDKKEFLNRLMLAIEEGMGAKNSRSLFDIEEELDQLQLQLIARTSSKEEYNDLAEKIYTLKDEKERVLQEEAGKENHKKNLQSIEQFIQTQDVETLEFEDKLVRQFVDKILVLDETIEVTFKTGTCVRIDG